MSPFRAWFHRLGSVRPAGSGRQAFFLPLIDAKRAGLEIGPSYNPIAPKSGGYNVRSLDHATRGELIEKYRHHSIGEDNLARIEEVDYVWRGEKLAELVGEQTKFSWIIAAHVIEHTPDLVGFLKSLSKLMEKEGVLCLAVPDKRYCFDRMRPVSTAGMVVEAHLRGDRRHGVASFVDTHLYTLRRHGVADTWDDRSTDDLRIPSCRWFTVHKTVAAVRESPNYVDIHRWVFTPASFELLIHDLRHLGFIDLAISNLVQSGEFEFFAALKHQKQAPDASGDLASAERQELLQRIRQEESE